MLPQFEAQLSRAEIRRPVPKKSPFRTFAPKIPLCKTIAVAQEMMILYPGGRPHRCCIPRYGDLVSKANLRSVLLLDGIKVIANLLVHLEHVYPGLFEDGVHLLVAADLALVVGILEVIGLYVFPETLDHTRP